MTPRAELWEYFFADLACYARKRLRAMNSPTGPADEEDAAERAFTKVCRAIERGRLKLGHRVDLKKVLRSATAHEVLNLHHRAKRSAGTTSDEFVLSQIPDESPSPELLMLALDACQRLLGLLESDALRRVAVWKLAGWTNEAIRVKLGCSLATVERALARIRDTWKREWADAATDRPAKPGPRHPVLRRARTDTTSRGPGPSTPRPPAGSSATWPAPADRRPDPTRGMPTFPRSPGPMAASISDLAGRRPDGLV